MRALIVSPTYFDPGSIVGGGERYPTELARKLAPHLETTLVSFSAERISRRLGQLRLEVFPTRVLLGGKRGNPLSFQFLKLLGAHDIVHNHQIFTMVSDLSCLTGTMLGRKIFVTDHGGGAPHVLNRRLPVLKGYHSVFCQSAFMRELLPAELRGKGRLIKGGVDQETFCPDPAVPRLNHLLFVGRLLPHKGVDYLIRAFRLWNRPDWRLRIVGRPYDDPYLTELQKLAEGLPVDFIQGADDKALLNEYRSARITILPSVHMDSRGAYSAVPELMGLTLIEAQSCGTPVVCTDAGAMPEFVEDRVTGRVAQQNSPESLAECFEEITHPLRWASYAEAARPYCRQYAMDRVAALHLEAYAEL